MMEGVVSSVANNSHPDTSHRAAHKRDRRILKRAIELVVEIFDETPRLIDYELKQRFDALWVGYCSDNTYRIARSKARDMGLVRDTGKRRTSPETKHQQIVWERCNIKPPIVPLCPTCHRVHRTTLPDNNNYDTNY